MNIITKVAKAMADYPLGSQDNVEPSEKIVHMKLFSLGSGASWYLTEFDVDSGEAFGYVEGLTNDVYSDEWGYFNLNELQSILWWGIPAVEIDKFFSSKRFCDISIRGR